MNSNLDSLLPKASNWYNSTVEHIGRGTAWLSNPKGYIAGNAVCRYDETGECSVELIADEWHNEDAPDNEDELTSLIWLSEGYRPAKSRGETVIDSGSITRPNTCERLEIETDDGVYISEEVERYHTHSLMQPRKIVLQPTSGRFQVCSRSEKDKKYWVLPLLNFITSFVRFNPEVNQHPLRIFPVKPEIQIFLTSDAPETEKAYAYLETLARSAVISFNYNGAVGFIERLSNYAEAESSLKSRSIRAAQTAIMVGLTRAEDEDITPIDFLPVLGVATGTTVGAPWIEFRDEQGALVFRYYANFGRPQYLGGYERVSDSWGKGGIGHLLTTASTSSDFGNSDVRAAMRNLTYALTKWSDITIVLFFLCAGLDVLADYKLKGKVRRSFDSLSKASQDEVKRILRDAADQVRREIDRGIDAEEKNILIYIAGLLNDFSVLQRRTSFGDKVATLMSLPEFNLHDLEVNGINGDMWKKDVTDFRNSTVHDAFYASTERVYAERLVTVTEHLLDIFVRLILHVLKYDGEYRPATKISHDSKTINWVTPDTPLEDLGY